MIIQYCSDLHLEFPENKKFVNKNINAAGDILILAGDIFLLKDINKHNDFFNFLSDNFKFSYLIPGNHEYYYYDIKEKNLTINERIRNNVSLVNNVSVIYENIKFIFSTLWSNIKQENRFYIEKNLSDFYLIRFEKQRLTGSTFNRFHAESLNFIKNEINKNETDYTVVATHHVPTLINYPEKYAGSKLNNAFATELKDYIRNSDIDYWIFGHHHYNPEEFTIGKTKMLSNQLGYLGYEDCRGFDFNKYFKI